MSRRLTGVFAVLLGIWLGACLTPGAASADGDPASDVLAAGSAFVPADAGFSAAQLSGLERRLAVDAAAGRPLRVAVIASAADLGSVSAAFGKPRAYANFLGYELSSVYRGRLLVVMPSGSAEVAVSPGARQPVAAPSASGSLAVRTLRAVGAPAGGIAAAPPEGTGPVSPVPWVVLISGALLVAGAWTVSLRARPLGVPRSVGRVDGAAPPGART
jgi:hypothetical protein